MRKPAGIENATEAREDALRLHNEGYGHKKISKMVGVCENTVKSWIRRHKVKEGQLPQPAKKVYDYICVQCGQAFQGNWNNQRKYCSSACSIKKSERKKAPREKEITVRSANVNLKQAREDAIYLNRCGCGYRAISEGLGISINTVKSWIRRHKAKGTTAKEDKAPKEGKVPKEGKAPKGEKTPKVKTKPKAYRYEYNHAKDAEEWVKHLHTQALPYYFGKIYETKIPVRLVCGETNMRNGTDALCMIIQNRLKMDPFDGGIYAFCGSVRERIRYIRWDGSGFELVSRRKEQGRYVWPSAHLGLTIGIHEGEFDFLLRGKLERDS